MTLTLDEKLKFCRACQNRKMDFNVGTVCGLTASKPDFIDRCASFVMDEPEAQRLAAIEKSAREEEVQNNSSLEGKGYAWVCWEE